MSSPFTLTIDWLAFTLPAGSLQDTMQMLGGDWTKGQTGFRGYPASWITTSASRGVGKLGTGAPRAPFEVHVDLSAGIVAPWPTEKVRTVLQWILKQEGHLTRLDCALDDRNSYVPLSTIRQAIEAGQCVTRADRMQRISSRSIHKDTPSGETLYLGSPQSQTMLRIYDKRLESQAKQREDWQDYGIRWELELKKDRAQVCGQVLSYLEDTDWLEFIVGVLRGYVDFRDTTRDEEDEFRYRAPLLDWWLLLTDGFKKGRLVVEKEAQTLPKVKRWVSQSVAPMLAVIYAADPGGHAWLERQILAGKRRWNNKHRGLLKKEIPSSSNQDAGGDAGAPFQGGKGVS
ncbi:MAG: replication initiation factor domain-containing protein [Nitrospirota bacterium]|nr:replication initiation factor domain-containing protein [Nitrospirota bacterium]MDP2384213.1 replication initiation factor domain-containing protein [Nitrospirota bacterium]